MAKVSKRKEAFKLFDEGKKPHDPEVVALGLSPGTAKKYLTMWRKQQKPSEEAPCAPCTEAAEEEQAVAPTDAKEVPVESIPNGDLFEHKGLLYKKRTTVYSGQVMANLMVAAHYTNILTQKDSVEFKPGLMVIPK